MPECHFYFDEQYTRHELPDGACVYVAGAVFDGDLLLRGEALAYRIAGLVESHASTGKAFALNGFYGACYVDAQRLVLTGNHLRSAPLFYARHGKEWHVGNQPWSIARSLGLGPADIDEASRIDFLACGYVCGDRTLLRNLHQLYADASIWIDLPSGTCSQRDNGVLLAMYDRSFGSIDELNLEHTRLLEGAMRRLIAYAAGRTIAVPLSAGLDSKLLVSLLKEFGYSDVIAFTYGRPNNAEAIQSSKVAKTLGIPWRFVEYNDELFRNDWSEMCRTDFLHFGSYISSMPHIQDFSAIKRLREEGILAPGTVIVPGHTPVGVLQPSDMTPDSLYSRENVVDFLFEKRMECSARLRKRYEYELKRNIRVTFPDRAEPLSALDFTQLAGYWLRRHREARYLVNSLRNYHYFGYDSWMPLWEVQYTRFENSIPIEMGLDRVWYEWYVEDLYARITGAARFPFVNTYRPRAQWWYQTLKRSWIGRMMLRGRQYMGTRRHPFCANAIYGDGELLCRIMTGDNVLAKFAQEAFDRIVELLGAQSTR